MKKVKHFKCETYDTIEDAVAFAKANLSQGEVAVFTINGVDMVVDYYDTVEERVDAYRCEQRRQTQRRYDI